MSQQSRFLGKWAIWDDTAQAPLQFCNVWFATTTLLTLYDDGSGSNLCFCQIGPAPAGKGLADLPYGAKIGLEGALTAALNAGDPLAANYDMPLYGDDPLDLPLAGFASSADVMVPAASQLSGRLSYSDVSPVPVLSGPPIHQFPGIVIPFVGLFVSGSARAFGWCDPESDPQSLPYTVRAISPSAKFARQFLGNAAPAASDYSLIDLSGEDYSGLTLQGANFNNSHLSGVNFQGCDLIDATFDGADLTDANFSGATLSNVDFTVAASVARCNFTNASLLKANFNGVDLAGMDFTGAHMPGTRFSNTDLTKASFSTRADFSPVEATANDFSHSTLNGEILGLNWSYFNLTMATVKFPQSSRGPTIAPLVATYTKLIGVSLAELNFHSGGDKANFSYADMRQCNLGKSNLAYADFTGALLQGDARYVAAVLTEANLENAIFTQANLTGANFSGAFLWGFQATLQSAIVIRTDFSNAYLVGLSFSDIFQQQCQGSNFDGSCLVNANFHGSDAGLFDGEPTSFVKACLQGADFTDAKLEGAVLTSAGVAQAGGSLPVTIQIGWPPKPFQTTVSFTAATLGIQYATDRTSICPNGQPGPCDLKQQTAPDAPTQWPVQGAGKKGRRRRVH